MTCQLVDRTSASLDAGPRPAIPLTAQELTFAVLLGQRPLSGPARRPRNVCNWVVCGHSLQCTAGRAAQAHGWSARSCQRLSPATNSAVATSLNPGAGHLAPLGYISLAAGAISVTVPVEIHAETEQHCPNCPPSWAPFCLLIRGLDDARSDYGLRYRGRWSSAGASDRVRLRPEHDGGFS